jgi:hypothetical protein
MSMVHLGVRGRGRGRVALGVAAACSVAGAVIAAVAVWRGADSPHAAVDPLAGSSQYWSSVGTAGVVDEQDVAIAKMNGAALTILNSAGTPAVLNARYGVTVSETFIGATTSEILGCRYVDNGPEAQVTLKLRSLHLVTGDIALVMEFDSNDYPPSDSPQLNYV